MSAPSSSSTTPMPHLLENISLDDAIKVRDRMSKVLDTICDVKATAESLYEEAKKKVADLKYQKALVNIAKSVKEEVEAEECPKTSPPILNASTASPPKAEAKPTIIKAGPVILPLRRSERIAAKHAEAKFDIKK